MLRVRNLCKVYSNVSNDYTDVASIKEVDLSRPQPLLVTDRLLREAERFWAASIMQLITAHHVDQLWMHSWGIVTSYYATFFAMNAILRLSGRTLTFCEREKKTYSIRRVRADSPEHYEIIPKKGMTNHKKQWDFYYDLIQNDVTDDNEIRKIFKFQLMSRHYDRKLRETINYDLSLGFDERHYPPTELHRIATSRSLVHVFEAPIDVLNNESQDSVSDEAVTIMLCGYVHSLFSQIALSSPFKSYWDMQAEKLYGLISKAPIENELRKAVLNWLGW